MERPTVTYVHGGVYLTDSFVICRELIYLDAVAHQLAHDLYFEFVELTLGDCVRFGNDGNYVDLRRGREKESRINKVLVLMVQCSK